VKSHPNRPSRRPHAEVRPFLPVRRAYLDVLAEGRRKHLIHGLIEIDVTKARRALRSRAETGQPVSFTAFVMHAVARAVDEDRVLQAYRRRNKLVLFDDVDINVQIEGTVAGQKIVKSLLVRAANRKTVEQITAEIRAGQRDQPADSRRYRGTLAFARIPRPVRAVMWRSVMSRPELVKRFGGTVAISSIGMFGSGGGWGIPIGPATLMITVGGIVTKPQYVDGVVVPRELLDLTITVDHAIVDGAPAARFARRLTGLLECADGVSADASNR
jgi:pyruvate/2-oxoglutarate dehydrogenase complex dihydrolipoamide acyltransferase (E2) component